MSAGAVRASRAAAAIAAVLTAAGCSAVIGIGDVPDPVTSPPPALPDGDGGPPGPATTEGGALDRDAAAGTDASKGCPSGTKVCGATCVALDDPAFGCGLATCTPCASDSPLCNGGACSSTCGTLTNCSGACADITSDPRHCGASCGACKAPTDGLPTCKESQCGFTCTPSYQVCGGTGCCPSYKTVFVTSELYSGDLGGLGGADAKCQALADARHLYGTFKAWLSGGNSANEADSRLTPAFVPYRLVDGTLVANSWSDLVVNALAHPINLTEKGGAPPVGTACSGLQIDFVGTSSVPVWTNTRAVGSFYESNTHCTLAASAGPWSSSDADYAHVGDATAPGIRWTNACAGSRRSAVSASPCLQTAALYCFQQ